MENAFAWLSEIVNWVGKFIPRWEIVPTTHGAVKFVRGSRVVSLGAGMHWYWPATTQFTSHPTARQAVDLRSQTLMTSDDVTIVAGGLVVYEIKNIEKIVAHTYDPDTTIRDITISVIHDALCSKTYADIRAKQIDGSLAREMRREAASQLDRYGVRVIRTTLTDLAKCRVYKVLQSTTQD